MSKYDNENKQLVYTYTDSKDTSNYLREFFNYEGQLSTRGLVKDNKEEGKWEWWYDNGIKKDEAYFTKGLYFNKRTHWYANGQLKKIEILFDTIEKHEDCPNEKCICYYDNGKLDQIYSTRNGINFGEGIIYNIDGSENHMYMKDGLRDGAYYEIYPNRKIKVKGFYKEGKQIGDWIWYDSIGKVIIKRNY